MTKQVQRRRGTATQHTSFTGAEGELSVNTTNKSVHVHDNVTAGGFEAARADMDNVTSSSILTAAGITATTAELNYVDGVTSAIQTQIDGKAGTASPTFTGTLTTANLTATGTTTLAGASTSADITFGDNDKAIFGAGSDLQIYHDGSDSFITDTGAGNLQIWGGNFRLRSSDGSEAVIDGNSGGAVTLYYDNAAKLATTSTGIDVTGTVTADGLTVEGNNNGGTKTTAAVNKVTLKDTDVSTGQQRIGQIDWFTSDADNAGVSASIYGYANNTSAISSMVFATGTASSLLDRMEIAFNGDISFYEDTGTTPKLFWDASAESLGIGTSSSDEKLEVYQGNIKLGTDTNTTSKLIFERSAANRAEIYVGSSNQLQFDLGGSEAMRIDSSGRVGIGTSSPDQILHLTKGSGATLRFESTTTGAVTGDIFGAIEFETQDSNSAGVKGKIDAYSEGAVGNTALRFHTGGTLAERMRIDSSGNVGIGTSSPSEKLEVSGTGHTRIQVTAGTSSDAAIYLGDSGDADAGAVIYDNAPNALKFRANGSEAMRIDSSGRVMIAETSNSGYSGNADDLIVGDNGSATERGISLGSTSASSIRFNDGSDAGVIEYVHSDNSMRFGTTNGTERMRLDASGNLLVGTTDTTLYNNGAGGNTGVLLRGSVGNIQAARSDGAPIDLNRLDSDGDIIALQKDGITVGSITSHGGSDLGIGAGDTGLRFQPSADAVFGYNNLSDSGRNGQIDLGKSDNRFKDLYLSGGVYLGGTGAANKLDDYEEGTWTPDNAALTIIDSGGVYVKIGSLVYASCQINYPSNSSSSDAHITGLPFSVNNLNSGAFSGAVSVTNYGSDNIYGFAEKNSNRILIRNNSNNNINCSALSNKFLNVFVVYRTA